MEIENRKSSGVAKAGLTTGIIGTALSSLGLLGNGINTGSCCSEDHTVDRYTLELQMKAAKLESEKTLLEADKNVNKKLVALYKDLTDKFDTVQKDLNTQAVLNQKTADSFQVVTERITNMHQNLECKIDQESKDRRCADNTIVTYVNATFVPNQIAEYRVSSETRIAPTYNPLPIDCGC